MSAPVAVQLADTLVSAATGSPGLHQGGSKTAHSAASSQVFSKLLLAAQQKGSASATPQPTVAKPAQDAAAGAKVPAAAGSVAVPPPFVLPQTSTATLNPIPTQSSASSHSEATKSAKDKVASVNESGKSKTAAAPAPPEQSTTATAIDPLLASQVVEVRSPAPMLLAASGPGVLSATATSTSTLTPISTLTLTPTLSSGGKVEVAKSESASSPVSKISQSGISQSGSALGGAGSASGLSSQATGGLIAQSGSQPPDASLSTSAQTQGQQSAWSSGGAADRAEPMGAVSASSSTPVVSASQMSQSIAIATPSGTIDAAGINIGTDGLSSIANTIAASAAPGTVRDSSGTAKVQGADTKLATSTVASSSAAASAVAASAVASAHNAAISGSSIAAHEMPSSAPVQAVQHDSAAQTTALHGTGAQTARMDGVERMATASPTGSGNANAHTILDGAGGTSVGGRNAVWQLSPNRIEAGFANGQDSWTSVVAQRQQGHVTATLELSSAAEHSSTASMLPQLNSHLVERQVSVDQIGVSVRQQFSSDRGAGDSNQGQQPSQSSQSQAASTPVSVVAATSVAATMDASRISIRA
jgi:hypothetical protein